MIFIKKNSIRKNYNINTSIPLNTIDKFIIDEYERFKIYKYLLI